MREDDMDEMLRKAADNYEVNADKASDWNFVYKAVHESEETALAEKKTKRRFLFWWLLLIPLGWLANTEYNNLYKGSRQQQNMPSSSIQTKSNKSEAATPPLSEKITGREQTAGNLADGNDLTNQPPVSNRHSIAQNAYTKNQNIIVDEDKGTPKSTPGTLHTEAPVEQQVKGDDNAEQHINDITPDDAKAIAPAALNATVKNDSSAAVSVQEKTTADVVGDAKKSVVKIKTSKNHFYAGLVAGADLSFVKYQELRPPGYNIGLLAGYKFKKFSVESGLLFVKKNYYTNGEYFDKSNIPYFDNAEILTVDGYCRMFEIPLNLKYNFVEKNRHSFFVTGGLSSYLMNKEFYDYAYIRDGQQHNGSKAYYHTTQNWFSVFNLSAGYELQMGAKSNLRIEPYLKAPLSGVGTGSLSISSAGIDLGITRRIP